MAAPVPLPPRYGWPWLPNNANTFSNSDKDYFAAQLASSVLQWVGAMTNGGLNAPYPHRGWNVWFVQGHTPVGDYGVDPRQWTTVPGQTPSNLGLMMNSIRKTRGQEKFMAAFVNTGVPSTTIRAGGKMHFNTWPDQAAYQFASNIIVSFRELITMLVHYHREWVKKLPHYNERYIHHNGVSQALDAIHDSISCMYLSGGAPIPPGMRSYEPCVLFTALVQHHWVTLGIVNIATHVPPPQTRVNQMQMV